MSLHAPQTYPLADWTRAQTLKADVLILGGGVAGLSAAIVAGAHADVLVITKDSLKSSNTAVAQGGVAAVLGTDDSFDSHVDDTIVVGCGLCEMDAVRTVVTEGPERIRELIEWGGTFDRSGQNLHLTLEGGHSQKRVVHANGDRTGLEVQRTLIEKTREQKRVRIVEHAFAVDLMIVDGRCVGAYFAKGRRQFAVLARRTILATGGAGQIYRETTNPEIATGDGIAMALRAGLEVRDMEFVQFHPTTLYVAGAARHLITEAVRGEGGYLRDQRGERFMIHYHPDAELAPRDVVSRSILRHQLAVGGGHVFLDLRHLGDEHLRRRFPSLISVCALYGIDAAKDLIPVQPSAHYLMGGIPTDLDGATEMPGLYACGETASSGLHGANRLASNSLLEGLVFGRRAGLAQLTEPPAPATLPPCRLPERPLDPALINVRDMINSVRSLMWREVGVLRSGESLATASQRLKDWSSYAYQTGFTHREGWELINILMTGRSIVESAKIRCESRGAHFRSDYPERNDSQWCKHTYYATDGIDVR